MRDQDHDRIVVSHQTKGQSGNLPDNDWPLFFIRFQKFQNLLGRKYLMRARGQRVDRAVNIQNGGWGRRWIFF
jgi:hypothetical protein